MKGTGFSLHKRWGRWLTAGALMVVLGAGCRAPVPTTGPSTKGPPIPSARETATLSELFGAPVVKAESSVMSQPSTSEAGRSEALMAYLQAKSALLEKDFKAAGELLKQSVQADPGYVPAHSLLTKLYFDQERLASAGEEAKITLKLDPADPGANYVLGTLLLKENDLANGGRYLFRAMSLWNHPDRKPDLEGMLASIKLGGALAGQGYYQAAMEVYRPLVKKMEQVEDDEALADGRVRRMAQLYRPALMLNLGELALKLRRYPEALDQFARTEKIQGMKIPSGIGTVRCLQAMGNKDEARERLDDLARVQGVDDRLVELYKELYPGAEWLAKSADFYKPSSDNLVLGLRLAELLRSAGREEQAVGVLKNVLRVDPSNSRAFGLLVKGYEQTGRMTEAAGALMEATLGAEGKIAGIPVAFKDVDPRFGKELVAALKSMAIPPKQEYAREYLLGLACQSAGEFESAERSFRDSVKSNPDFIPSRLSLGQILMQERRWMDVSTVMEQSRARKIKAGGVLYLQGASLMEQNRIREALDILTEANRITPESDQILLTLAECYLRMADPSKAFDQLKQIIGNNLAGPQTMSRLVQMLLEAQGTPLAQAVLQQYSQRFGKDGEYKLLTAKMAYTKTQNQAQYRSDLAGLMKSGYRSGSLDRERAELEFDACDYEQAVMLVDQALVRDKLLSPRDYQRLLQIAAFSYWRTLDYRGAERVWLTLLKTWPNLNVMRVGLARMYMDAQDYEKAIPLIQELLTSKEADDQKPQYQVWLVTAFLGLDRTDEAVKTMDGWLSKAAKDERARYLRLKLECLVRKNRNTEALRLLEQLVSDGAPPVRQWRQMLIALLIKDNRAAEAVRRSAEYAASSPEKERYYLETLRIEPLLAVKRYNDAVTLAEDLAGKASTEQKPVAVLGLIACLQKAGQFDRAIETAKVALKEYGQDRGQAFTFHHQIVHTFELAKRYGEGEKWALDRRREADPVIRTQWQQVLVSLYFTQSNFSAADKILEEILAGNPGIGWANNSYGYSLADRGKDLDRAERLIRKALTTEPGSASYLDSLGWVLFRKGDIAQSYRYATMALRAMIDPDPVVLDHLGDICLKMGKSAEARRFWEQSVQACSDRDPSLLEPGMPDRTVEKLRKFKPASTRATNPAQ